MTCSTSKPIGFGGRSSGHGGLDFVFCRYGRIRTIDIKTPARPPAYAFITFDDDRDADDAVRARDGYNFDGRRIRVEFSRGRGGGEPL